MSNLDTLFSSVSTQWLTPKDIIDRTLKVFDKIIDLDPCAEGNQPGSEITNFNVPARVHWTIVDNCLDKDWFGNVYMNPPYGREISKFIKKFKDEYMGGRMVQGIALVPARTDTAWFEPLFDFPVCFIRGRLKFTEFDETPANARFIEAPAPFPSAIVYAGNDNNKFFEEFRDIGTIV